MTCTTCNASSDLYPGRKVCRECRKAEKRAAYHADPEGSRARRARYYQENRDAVLWRQTLGKYGITKEQFDALLEKQGGRCAICDSDKPGGHGNWHVDHDHNCCPSGKSCGACVRGLLCNRCNPGIGYFQDDPVRLLKAADYLLAGLSGSGQPSLGASVVKRIPTG